MQTKRKRTQCQGQKRCKSTGGNENSGIILHYFNLHNRSIYSQIRMSVLLNKDDTTTTKHLGTSTASATRDKSPRQKAQSKLQHGRDTVKIVNEKNAVNLQVI